MRNYWNWFEKRLTVIVFRYHSLLFAFISNKINISFDLIKCIKTEVEFNTLKTSTAYLKAMKSKISQFSEIALFISFSVLRLFWKDIFFPLSTTEKRLSVLRSHFLTKMLEIFRNYYSKYEEWNVDFYFCLNVLQYELRKLMIDGASTDSRKTLKNIEIGSWNLFWHDFQNVL